MCSAHLPPHTQPEAHFRAVCRALLVEYEELCAFLRQVSRGTSELKKIWPTVVCSSTRGQTEGRPLEDLQSADWARLWMQVIRQLRNGVKLRKVENDCLLSRCEFELTPYEMLLNDIRLRRYKLKHVDAADGQQQQQLSKRDAHDLILEFIRSRPPLVPVSQRTSPPTPPKVESAHDLLMKSIRMGHSLRPVSRPSSPSHQSEAGLGRVLNDLPNGVPRARTAAETKSAPLPRKRHIIPDLDFSSIGSDDEDCTSTVIPMSTRFSLPDNRFGEKSVQPSRDYEPAVGLPDSSHRTNPPFSLTIFFRTFARYLNLSEKSQKGHNMTPMRHMCDNSADDERFSSST